MKLLNWLRNRWNKEKRGNQYSGKLKERIKEEVEKD